jgi:RimJ/RimL family protein N-acetyltransferase
VRETPRLTLIAWSPEQLRTLISQPERFGDVGEFPLADGVRQFFATGDVSPEWAERLEAASGPDPWRFGFFVVEKESRSVIGTAAFKGPPDSNGTVEIAYAIVPSHEGRGYATEAAAALVEFALADPRVRLVRAHTLPASNASTRVLEKNGFRHAGTVVDPEDGPVWRWERQR